MRFAARSMWSGTTRTTSAMTGLIGFSSGYYAMRDCDALLMLGTDFPYRQFYPEGRVRIAQLDIRPQNLGRRAPIELGLVGDVAATIEALLPRLEEKTNTAHLDIARRNYREARKGLMISRRDVRGGA